MAGLRRQETLTGAEAMVRRGAEHAAPWRWAKQAGLFFRRKPMGAVGAMSLIVVVLAAILAGLIAPYDPLVQDVPSRLQPPSAQHLFGTDEFGRDVFTRILFGARVSLYVGLLSVLSSSAMGTIVGVGSGYLGGKLDLAVQRVVDALMGFPALVIAILLIAALGSSLNNVVIAISIAFAPRLARIARSTALSVKENDYVLAATALGAGTLRVLVYHVIPNCLTPLIVISTGYLGSAIVAEAALSFLGLGVPPPHPSWGQMLQGAARRYTEAAPWMVVFPGVALTVAVFGFNLFGDALRDTLDPRLRGR